MIGSIRQAARILGGVAAGALLVAACVNLFAQPPKPKHHRIPVIFWHMWTGEWTSKMDDVVDEFNKSQDKYEVIPLLIPPDGFTGETSSKFLMSVAGGDPPDVMAQWAQAISGWAQDGILQPLDPLMSPEDRQAYAQCYPVVRKNGWYNGHLYGMVTAFDVYACYYRLDDFQQAGLDPDRFPSTLEDLIATGRKLDKYDSQHNLVRVGFLPQTFTNYVGAYGGGFYDPSTGTTPVDTPQNLEAMTTLVDASKQLGIDKVIRFNSSLNSGDAGNWPFIGDQMSITLDGEWRVEQLADYAPHLQYRIAPLPPPAKGGKPLSSFSMIDYLTIPKGAKNPEGAWEFIKFWSGLDHPERAAKYKAWFCWLPSSPAMAASPEYQKFLHKYPQYQTFVKLAASDNIVATPPVPYQLFLMDRIQDADDYAMRGAISPGAALKRVDAQVKQELNRRKELGYEQ